MKQGVYKSLKRSRSNTASLFHGGYSRMCIGDVRNSELVEVIHMSACDGTSAKFGVDVKFLSVFVSNWTNV